MSAYSTNYPFCTLLVHVRACLGKWSIFLGITVPFHFLLLVLLCLCLRPCLCLWLRTSLRLLAIVRALIKRSGGWLCACAIACAIACAQVLRGPDLRQGGDVLHCRPPDHPHTPRPCPPRPDQRAQDLPPRLCALGRRKPVSFPMLHT
jgi:hypothetical protein